MFHYHMCLTVKTVCLAGNSVAIINATGVTGQNGPSGLVPALLWLLDSKSLNIIGH